MSRWCVGSRTGSAADLHARPVEAGPGRRVEHLAVDRPALVLGSTQPPAIVDDASARAAGIEVVRRRSGGGAVLLEPGRSTWVDVTITRDDPLWQDDVGLAFHWLGHAWAAALGCLGVVAAVHVERPLDTAWSRRVCFAGIGAGEVVVGRRKLVGISQRRTRDAARFQCLVHRSWDPGPLVGLLALADHERAAAQAELAEVAVGLDVAEDVVVRALVASLPDSDAPSPGARHR